MRLRRAESDEELKAWRWVRIAVLPNERTDSVEELRRGATPERLLLLADVDGEVVGSGHANRSDQAGLGSLGPRVLPEARRRGVGTALLEALAAHLATLGFAEANSMVDDEGSLAFAERFGFREVDRQVEQVRTIGREEPPRAPAGVELVSLAERPDLSATEGSFVALAGDEIVGCAGLMRDLDRPDRAEHGLTAVRRDWRGRGLAKALKQATIVWAAENGIRELYTWTQRGNENMRRVNERLGYVVRSSCVSVRGPLPLRS